LSDEGFNILNIEKGSTSGSVTLPDNLEITVQHFNINSGKFITGGDLKIGGNFNAPISGTFNPTQGAAEFIGLGDAWINMAAGNNLNNLIVNKPNFGQLELFSELDIHSNLHIQSGELILDGYNVEAINITIESLGILNSGSSNIDLHGNWANYHGYDGFIEDGSSITFIDFYYQSSILTEDQFNLLTIQKLVPEGSVAVADGVSFRANQIEINSGKFITGDNTSALIYNDVIINSNSSLIMPDAPLSGLLQVGGEFSVNSNALFEIGSGNEVSISQFIHDGELRVYGGDMNCSSVLHLGSSSSTEISDGILSFSKTSPIWLDLDGEITIAGGILDAHNNSINFEPSLIGNFSGGSIKTGGSLKAQHDNVFQQNGGEVIFAGDFDSTLYLADGCYINDFVFNRTGGTLALQTDLNVANDFTINSGYFDNAGEGIFVGRNWANYAGPSAINLSSGSVHFNSDKPASILTDETFNALIIDKSFADGNYLDVAANKNIQVNKHFIALDGMLRLFNKSFLGVNVGFQLQDGAGIRVEASADTATLRIKMDWDNQNTTNDELSGFYPFNSTVIFDGTSDQAVYGASFEEGFYNLVVQKPSGEFKSNANIAVTNDIIIEEGIWTYDNTGLYYDLYGNLTIQTNGSWQDDQNLLVFSSGDDVSFSNFSSTGSVFGNINTNLSEASTNLIINGDISCEGFTAGKGHITMADSDLTVAIGFVITNDGTFEFPIGNDLRMGNNSYLVVSGGLLSFIGSEANNSIITRESTGHYTFDIQYGGSLAANYTTFEYMDVNGVHVYDDGFVAGENPLHNCTFQNGEAGGTLLKVGNSQELEITKCIFPINNWGGMYNVSKLNNEGNLTFVDASGDYSGDVFENDNYNRINWEESAIRLNVKAYLEGPFDGSGMHIHLNSFGLLPLSQPYNQTPWNYSGLETVTSIPANVVDWLLVELRDATDASLATPTTSLGRQAAFILNDGNIVGLDGSSLLSFDYEINHQLYILLWHRNHLPVMSMTAVPQVGEIYTYNFTTSASKAYGNNQSNLDGGVFGMIAGDLNADGDINDFDLTEQWDIYSGKADYFRADGNMDRQVNNPDKNDVWYPNLGKTEIFPE